MNNGLENSVNYELLAKFFAGSSSRAENQEIEDWRNSAAQNETEFQELQLVWLDTGTLIESETKSLNIDVNDAWEKLNNRLDTETEVIPITGRSKKNTSFLRIAAAIAVVFISYFVINIISSKGQTELTASNEVVTQELIDGTTITLNKESILTYPEKYADDIRKVELDGEAFFEVERDTLKPFVIQAGKALVTVLGTSFNVDAHSKQDFVSVFVESGKVRLSFEESEAILTVGMTGVLDKRTGEIEVLSDADENIDAWRDHNLVFRRSKLKNVVKTLNELYEINIELGSENLEDCKLSAKFEDESIENILDIIISTFNLEMMKVNDKIILNGEGC